MIGWYFLVTVAQVVAKENHFAQKVVTLCVVWWNFEGIINHFELVQNDAVNAAVYLEQFDCVYSLSRLVIIQP